MDISAQIKERMEDILLRWGNYCESTQLDLCRIVQHIITRARIQTQVSGLKKESMSNHSYLSGSASK